MPLMKHLLLTTIAAVLLVGCGESQQSVPAPEAKPAEPVAETAKPEPPTAKAPDISIHDAASAGNIEAVQQHLAAGTDVNVKDNRGRTPLYRATNKEIAKLLIASGADVNAKDVAGGTPLHAAIGLGHKETVELLINKGSDVNAKVVSGPLQGSTPLDWAITSILFPKGHPETAALLRKHGGKTGEELKAEGK